MSNFIFERNIARYKELLATETDHKKIAMLSKLWAEEETKFAEWRANSPIRNTAE
jgi:hypothetical protein